MAYNSLTQLIQKTITRLRMVASESTSLYASDAIALMLEETYEMVRAQRWWDHLLSWESRALDGTTGQITQPIVGCREGFRDIKSIFYKNGNLPIPILSSDINPYRLAGTQPRFIEPINDASEALTTLATVTMDTINDVIFGGVYGVIVYVPIAQMQASNVAITMNGIQTTSYSLAANINPFDPNEHTFIGLRNSAPSTNILVEVFTAPPIFRVWPLTTLASVAEPLRIRVRRDPVNVFTNPSVVVPFDATCLINGAAYKYATDDGTNPAAVDSLRNAFEARLAQLQRQHDNAVLLLDPRQDNPNGSSQWTEDFY